MQYYQKYYELLPHSRVWYVLLTLGFAKGTRGNVKVLLPENDIQIFKDLFFVWFEIGKLYI